MLPFLLNRNTPTWTAKSSGFEDLLKTLTQRENASCNVYKKFKAIFNQLIIIIVICIIKITLYILQCLNVLTSNAKKINNYYIKNKALYTDDQLSNYHGA